MFCMLSSNKSSTKAKLGHPWRHNNEHEKYFKYIFIDFKKYLQEKKHAVQFSGKY